jgi:hypothetical protein
MRILSRVWRKFQKNERGQIAILVGVMMTGIIGFSALAIDVGSLVSDKRDLQNAADAMALAGAQELGPDPASVSAARATAQTWASKNGVAPDEIVTPIDVDLQHLEGCDQHPPGPDCRLNPQITVTLHRHHPTILARVIGIGSVDLEVTASAIKTSPGGSDGITPWSVLESAVESAPPGTLTTLKWDANDILKGNTMPIQIDGSGGAVYEETIKHGSIGTLCSVEALKYGCVPTAEECLDATCDSLTGDKIGPTKQGLQYIYDNTDPACNEFSQVFATNADGSYSLKAECNPFVEGSKRSLRVIIVPIIESLGNGTSPVAIKEFGLFFLEGTKSKCTGNDCQIQGRFIRANFTTGSVIGIYDPNGLVHFIRLVQ